MRTRAYKKIKATVAALIVLLMSGCCIALADIGGSGHDFSGRGWGTTEICIFCHTPHNAKTPQLTALWNHESTAASYTLYSSPTMHQQPEQPRDASKICLSCHDGTVAIESYGGRTGTHSMTGDANLGTDLSNDHPVSVLWDHQTNSGGNSLWCTNCHLSHSQPSYVGLPFYNGYLECSTCHDPHNKFPAYTKMLRKSLAGSALCQSCHNK
jgi:predicted CXXCH cytochrome family protein